MSFHNRNNLNNALLRRVRQHGALTTLFGAGSPSLAAGSSSQPGEIQAHTGVPLVKATLVTSQGLSPAVEPLHANLVPEDTRLGEKAAIQQAEQPPKPHPVRVHGPTPGPITAQPAAQPGESQDRSWQLLKKIFRKHQEQVTEPQGEPQPDKTTQPVPAPPSHRISRHSPENNTRATELQLTEQTPPLHPPEAARLESVGQVSKPASPRDIHLDPVGQISTSYPQGVPAGSVHVPLPSKTHVAIPGTPHGTPIDNVGQISTSYPQGVPARLAPSTEPGGQSPTPSDQEGPAGTQHAVPGSVGYSPAAVQTARTNPETEKIAADSYPHTATAAQPSDPRPLELHALPIEAVWPVQKRDFPQPGRLSTPGSGRLDPHSHTGLPALSTPSQQEITEAALPDSLARVPTGQPTRSQVEVISPRRPRPTSQESVRRSTLHPTRPSVPDDTQVAGRQDSSFHASTPPVDLQTNPALEWLYEETSATQPSLAAPKPSIQPSIQPATPQNSDLAASPNLIPTAIGPLPADLWHLLKQPQPGSSERPQVPVPPRSPADNPPAFPGPGGNQAPAASQGDGLPLLAPQTSAGSLVQRSPDPGDPAASRAASHTPEPSETSQQTAPQLDLDELANRVYLDIKRKLAVEWERSRHRG